MKKPISILVALLMLLAVIPVQAKVDVADTPAHVRLGGYIAGDKDGAAL